VREHNLNI